MDESRNRTAERDQSRIRTDGGETAVEETLTRVRTHDFHPVDDRNFTIDRTLATDGIADLADPDWRVRLVALRDLVRLADSDGGDDEALAVVRRAVRDNDPQVRYLCVKALGIVGDTDAAEALERVVRTDPNGLVRAEAAASLGRLATEGSLELLERVAAEDDDRDVSHQAEVAVDRIRKGAGATEELRRAYRDLDPDSFGRVTAGDPAPDFRLSDTEGIDRRLADLADDDEWLVLVWVFADWCPVCHREFDELFELREAFEDAGVSVATVECHDRYRGRLMVGRELEPDYWFAEESFLESYAEAVWWPHLLDLGGAVGARYGVDPMAFAVHAEYINRPATVVVDPNGIVRLAYVGTFWGDRPSIEETLEMIRTEEFTYENPDRLSTVDGSGSS